MQKNNPENKTTSNYFVFVNMFMFELFLKEKKVIEKGTDTRKYDFREVCKDLAP